MKLILAIINNDDSVRASAELNKAGFFVTRLSTTGGFLMVGNTTLLIGTEEEGIEKVKEILHKTCATRRHVPASHAALGRGMTADSLPTEVTVGGATIFVLNVEETAKF